MFQQNSAMEMERTEADFPTPADVPFPEEESLPVVAEEEDSNTEKLSR
jgi:hypothetical protein